MIKTAICGINGRMGQVLCGIIADDPEMQLCFGVDKFDEEKNGVPVYAVISEADPAAVDVIIDFSRPDALEGNLAFAVEHKKAIVIATTGYSPEQREMIRKAGEKTAVFFSENYSLGVNLQMRLIAQAARLFKDSADIEIIEKHHNRKADAPSGTALMLADGINEACGGIYTYKYGRTPEDGKRDKREIGIHAVRGGNIVGVHDVLFITDNEIVTISHQAQSRSVFADGAIAAAKFVCGRGAGYYDMQSMLDEG